MAQAASDDRRPTTKYVQDFGQYYLINAKKALKIEFTPN